MDNESPFNPEIDASSDPIALFEAWFAEARARESNDPDAVTLATADALGRPNARVVLLKHIDANGFVFYTNTESVKGDEIRANAWAALCFYWKSLDRQVRVRGPAALVGDAEADAYFATRPKDSQIGAWASRQSRPLEGRFALEKEVARFAAKYALTKVPRPPYWSGYRVQPLEIEFWRNRPFRLHDRLLYRRESPQAPWRSEHLYP
ncbi:MAG: pyridoxamine 5'-phosphate oxidase [Alphaproteobacteria bacterium]